MNIFEIYRKKLQDLITANCKNLNIDSKISFDGVVIEIPPQEFNFDISSNIALVLAKKSNQAPVKLANLIKDILIKDFNDFSDIAIAGPGFINFRFNSKIYQKLILDILKSNDKYGSSYKKKEKYNIEFVSANPTGPMHIGHSRGAIYGDVLANLLKFNGNIVTKEYYINDYGNQITNFTKSVYLRIREIKYNEKFVLKENLYPGDYIVEIGRKIIESNTNNKFNSFDECFELVKILIMIISALNKIINKTVKKLKEA